MSEISRDYAVKMSFPGNLGYVSPVRKFISELLLMNRYSQKFAYRSEVIVDEICTNAIQHGDSNKKRDKTIDLSCTISTDKFEVNVHDSGGSVENLDKLKSAVEKSDRELIGEDMEKIGDVAHGGFGLEIVRMLSEEVELKVDDNNVTSIRVVRTKK